MGWVWWGKGGGGGTCCTVVREESQFKSKLICTSNVGGLLVVGGHLQNVLCTPATVVNACLVIRISGDPSWASSSSYKLSSPPQTNVKHTDPQTCEMS